MRSVFVAACVLMAVGAAWNFGAQRQAAHVHQGV
jgi:hypothetical protein